MIDLFFLNNILIILIDALGIWLGFWVYLGNKKAKGNRLFTLMIILTLLWITLCYFSGITINNLELSLFLGRLAYGAAILFLIPFYFFSCSFLKEEKKFPYFNILIPIGSISIFFFSVFTNFMAEHMVPVKFGVVPFLGEGKFVYFGFVFSVALFVITRLFINYFKSSEKEKLKLQYFFIGIFIFVIANLIFNVVLAFWEGIVRYYQFGNYSAIFLLGFTAYAIVKRELFGIKVVVTSIFVVLIAILLALDALLFTQVLAIQILKGIALAIFIVFGYMLIKSVSEEVKRREELEKLNRAKSEFISMASHQLRTPLTAIKGYSSLLTEGTYGKVEPKCDRVLRNIFISTERLIKIVNDLLNLSRVDLGKLELDKKPTKIEKLVEEVYREMKPLAKAKNIEFVLEKPEIPLPQLNVDPLKIRQVISNLVDNAIKYTEKGKVSIKIEKIRSRVRITILDTGRGFSEEEKSKLFQLFVRGKAGIDSFIEGSGIGLSVAKKFVELHKGTIFADSPGKNKGATFWFELPIEKESNNKLLDYLSQE